MTTQHSLLVISDRDRTKQSRFVRILAGLAAFTIVGVSVYASQKMPSGESSTAPAGNGSQAQAGDKALQRVAKAVAAGKAFVDSLDAQLLAKAVLPFESPKKPGWSNLPVTNVPRNGVRLGDLTPAQRGAAMELLAATLSAEGNQKIIDILEADEVLATGKGGGKGKGGKTAFGKDNYFLALFGQPSATDPWMVQFGGHHLGLNVTVVAKSFVLTPTHTGTQPEAFTRDGKKVRPLGGENDQAFKLINALDDSQRAQAILKEKVKEMLLGPGKDGKTIKQQGIRGSALTQPQKAMLLDLIGEWVNIVNRDDAAARLAEIKGSLDETYFAWSGPTTNGSAAYFRVHGPTLVIEYAPQGTTDHIHTVIRDPSNDYGSKLTKR